MTLYAELAAATNFSFLRGASHPREMVDRAGELGLTAIGIADRNSFAGVVRAHDAAKRRKDIRLLVGTRLVTLEGFETIAYPTDRAAYGRLCRLLSDGNRKAKKGDCHLYVEDVLAASEGQMLIAMPPRILDDGFALRLASLARKAKTRVFLGASNHLNGDAPRRLGLLAECSEQCGAPLVAVNDALHHHPDRRRIADILTCIREKCTLAEAGFRLEVNAERHLKAPDDMARLFAAYPEAIARSLEIAEACRFSLDELKYEYPDEPVPPGKTPQEHLAYLTWEGAARRYPKRKYPAGLPEDVVKRLHDELAIIEKLEFARYFLTVHDIVAYARQCGILCQGRGSAANSAVCYCLGITEVDPNKTQLLFARFISQARGEPPDIDVDFEHERREEVIQYIYKRYGRHRAAICATVIHYRSRRAIGEVGKVLGLTPDITAALSKTVWGSYGGEIIDDQIRQAGLDPRNSAIRQAVELAGEITGFPRHLSQHVGGFVLTRERLDDTVPIGNAAMDDRTFIEWDKDDIDTLGLMKVDVLALGMLSCIKRALTLLKVHHNQNFPTLADLPQDDPVVYEMLSRADLIGVFQVESRAQMSMLPRLKPREFYDLVIEVAIVRPGPIQGDMVHPYLRRRDGIDQAHYPSPSPDFGPANELEEVLKRTLGVPLFQEQAMQIAITAAEFSPDEADGLRRAMATFRHNGTVHLYRDKFIDGMTRRGYEREFAERCFSQIEGFGEYGFPESHAASFALLVYVSSWIKCHYPDVFCAAILNSQPMGFYQPAQLVRDAKEHGVEIRAADVNFSDWDSTLESASPGSRHGFAVRLGFNQVKGLQASEIDRLVENRGNSYASIERLSAVACLSAPTIQRLAEADAFGSLNIDRRAALWMARRLGRLDGQIWKKSSKTKAEPALPLFAAHLGDELFDEPQVPLSPMRAGEQVLEDYVMTGLSLKAHPCSFFRDDLERRGVMRNSDHRDESLRQGKIITVAGLVLVRQRPGTSKGVVFMTLEDETGVANIIVWPKIFEANRRIVMTSRFLAVKGNLQRAGLVVHVVAQSFIDLSGELRRLADREDVTLPKSRDFH